MDRMSYRLNIVVTSKPVDGLLYYSYEYCSYLTSIGVDSKVVIVCHQNFTKEDYLQAISKKYIHCKNVDFDDTFVGQDDITLIMGRSMMSLSYQNFKDYTPAQRTTLKNLFSKNVISVYSENHPTIYPLAVNFYSPKQLVNLCDHEVYPNGVGEHFEKTINFEIYKPYVDNVQFKYLFLGTNERYYHSVEKVIDQYPDHGILTYNEKYVNIKNNNVFAPVENLLGMFDAYVYTKETFDPAPRIFQECKYFGKEVIYLRDKTIIDGGSVYWKRDIKNPDVSPILKAIEELYEN